MLSTRYLELSTRNFVCSTPGMEELELDATKLPRPIDWKIIFGNNNPIEIEIGFGKGRFLIRSALENPGKNYLGVEVSAKCMRITKERVLKRGLKNIRVIKTDAENLISQFIPDCSVCAYHIYFPDPWPKRRHAKRRLFKENFVIHVERTLIPGGHLNVTTDVSSYYELILELITVRTRLFTIRDPLSLTVNHEPQTVNPEPQTLDQQGLTNYEIKYRREGRAIYYGHWQRLPSDSNLASF